MENESKSRRVTMALRQDLNDRVLDRAPALGLNPNQFVNQCVEGILDAMDSSEISHDIPILKLSRVMQRKTLLDSKAIHALISLFVPKVDEITAWHRHYLAEQLNQHDGPLTHEIMEFYWKRATEQNMQRLAAEKALQKLKQKKSSAK